MTYLTPVNVPTRCCLCEKPISGIEVFGPVHYPVCEKHWYECGEELEVIDRMPKSTLKDVDFANLRLYVTQHPSGVSLEQSTTLREKLEDLEEDKERLEIEITDLEDELSSVNYEIRKLKRLAAALGIGQ